MKIQALIPFLVLVASSVQASVPPAVDAATKAFRSANVRTVATKVENTDGNPCMPQGVSYTVELQVRQATLSQTGQIEREWQTIRTINVAPNGDVMEVCAE